MYAFEVMCAVYGERLKLLPTLDKFLVLGLCQQPQMVGH